jgi:uncharacterized lipoprotein YddW (UPF0748 family)
MSPKDTYRHCERSEAIHCFSGLLRAIALAMTSFLVIAASNLSAQSPKRDVRAVWLSTVWGLDWPSVTVPAATGTNESEREAVRNIQKSGLVAILNKLQAANFNTVFFQVRGMSDAFYNSKYEPWSQYLSSQRGADPGWDPLAYIVDEAHTRGIEVHAWINPYRYSTAAASHGNLPSDYATLHPDWLMDYGSYTKILNPGMPEVRKQICDIIEDIITQYDVDGIVFDDYFYADAGARYELDNAQYQTNNPTGLSQADWRRNNINQMVRDVQTRINGLKPYLTFGISPAGVAASDPAVAAKYGVDRCPVGSDWQYSGIYSDPLAWLYDGSIDYISPQCYWAIGAGNDYARLSPWWAKVANKFGKLYFSSNTSSYSNASTELPAEVQINRDADLNGTTGAVFFRTNNIAQAALNSLKANSYQNPALGAAYGWKTAPVQALVENLMLSGNNLAWNYTDNNVRYCVYVIPNANRNDADAFTSSKYIRGITYSNNYILPGINTSTHKIAVSVYDRYGNEFPPRILDETETNLAAAELIYPAADAEDVVLPALFTWDSPTAADYYVWELSANAEFTQPIVSREIETAEFNSGLQSNIKENTTYYWRVKSLKANAPLAISEVRSFKGAKFRITSPADAAVNVSMTPDISWTSIGPGATYTLEISTVSNFNSLVYTADVQTTTVNVPTGILSTATTYYVRVRAILGVMQAISEQIHFVTEEVPIPVPVIISPADGATIAGNEIEISWQLQDSKGFQAELSQNSTFPSRGTKLKAVDAFIFSTVFSDLEAGAYYLRVKAKNSEGLTEPSEFVTVYLTGNTAIPDINYSVTQLFSYSDATGNCYIIINNAENSAASINIYSITGMLLDKKSYGLNAGKNTLLLEMTHYAKGFYLVKINVGSYEKTLKVRK